jgi:hypothetical protein
VKVTEELEKLVLELRLNNRFGPMRIRFRLKKERERERDLCAKINSKAPPNGIVIGEALHTHPIS